jgi:hypothetical protein
VDAAVQRLLDREAIVECTLRYTRGVDRLDEELVRSAFHEDARAYHHSEPFSPDELVDWYWPRQPEREASQHYLTNHTIEINGDTAHGECYFLAVMKLRTSDEIRTIGGRYVDRFERRDGEWRIAVRLVVSEWHAVGTAAIDSEVLARGARGSRSREDPSYERPLRAR